jgi:hypothetical protein
MAIAYDFDGTLAPGNMQDRDFIPALQITPRQFWQDVKAHAKRHDMDEILAYMDLMRKRARDKEVKIQKEDFQRFGKTIRFFPGVPGWFARINRFATRHGVRLEHYIISSGLREMIDGTAIRNHFQAVFASGFRYDQHSVAVWPALAINYTTKTQYLFRINKGIDNAYDNVRINRYTPDQERRVPFRNMVYIGDGDTDIPCMKMIKYQGGYAVAVYQPRRHGSKARAMKLVHEQRADYVFPADYTAQSGLSHAIEDIILKVAAENRLLKAGKPRN